MASIAHQRADALDLPKTTLTRCRGGAAAPLTNELVVQDRLKAAFCSAPASFSLAMDIACAGPGWQKSEIPPFYARARARPNAGILLVLSWAPVKRDNGPSCLV